MTPTKQPTKAAEYLAEMAAQELDDELRYVEHSERKIKEWMAQALDDAGLRTAVEKLEHSANRPFPDYGIDNVWLRLRILELNKDIVAALAALQGEQESGDV